MESISNNVSNGAIKCKRKNEEKNHEIITRKEEVKHETMTNYIKNENLPPLNFNDVLSKFKNRKFQRFRLTSSLSLHYALSLHFCNARAL